LKEEDFVYSLKFDVERNHGKRIDLWISRSYKISLELVIHLIAYKALQAEIKIGTMFGPLQCHSTGN